VSTSPESGADFNRNGVPRSSGIRCHVRPEYAIWKGRRAKSAWVALKPEDVKRVLREGLQPVRSPEELFKLVCELIEHIRSDIEGGEEDIRSILWDGDNPKVETEFQKMIARDLRQSIEANKHKIVSGRELEVAGNRPDIFTTCILPGEKRARVFLEMKRQQFYEKTKGCDASDVISSIRTQLIEKYLVDAETSYGIYIVGWYGQEYFGSYKTKLKRLNRGRLPCSPSELEDLLQRIAGDEVAKAVGVSAVRVFVIDLELGTSRTPC